MLRSLAILWLGLVVVSHYAPGQELFTIPRPTTAIHDANCQDEHDMCLLPQSIAVDQNHNIYILQNRDHKVLVFNKSGQRLKTFAYRAEGCGLAVSPDGILAVFSPSAKTVTWINGPDAGKIRTAPASFAALSEVWFQQGIWLARCGYNIAPLEDVRSDMPLPSVFVGDNGQITLRLASARDVNYTTFVLPTPALNAWAIGRLCASDRIGLAVQTRQGLQIRVCDLQGNSSEPVTVRNLGATMFCSYTMAPDGSLYEMAATDAGIAVYYRNCLQTMPQKLATSRELPAQLEEFWQSQRQQSTTSGRQNERTPASIYVYFSQEGQVRLVDLQSYLKGVVSAEIYSSWHLEAHRAMAVAARTYAVARVRHPSTSPKANVCTTTHCQAWTSNIAWKAEQGVNDTNQLVLYYNGVRVTEPLYFAHCNGRTRNSEDYNGWNYIAYLRSVPCSCGHTQYYGHGVGACQYGLQAYANSGWNYVQILQHFYTGVTVKQ